MRDRRRMNQLLGLGFAVLLAGFTAANYFHKGYGIFRYREPDAAAEAGL